MAEIQIIAKESHQPLAHISGTSAKLTEASIVLLKVSPQDISMLKREGTEVIVYLKNGEVIKIENFFSETEVTDNSLVLGAGTEQLIWARFTNNEGIILNVVQYQPLENIDGLLYGAEASNLVYWAALPLAVGAGYMINDHNKKDSSETKPEPIKPADPTHLSMTADGKYVKGQAEAGRIVIVRDANGKVIGSGLVNTKGEFNVTLDQPLTNGEVLKLTVQDAAGNSSAEVEINAPDTTKPSDPTNITIELDGSKVRGKGEAGAEVIIKDKDGKELGKAKVNDKGEFEVKFDPPLNAGQDIQVSIKDPAGNQSADVAAKVPPHPPTITDFDGQHLSGTASPGLEVKVYVNGEIVGSDVADRSGNYSIKLIEKFSHGETITIMVLDDQGNFSKAVEYQAPDLSTSTSAVIEFESGLLQAKAETEGHFKVKLDTAWTDVDQQAVLFLVGEHHNIVHLLAENPLDPLLNTVKQQDIDILSTDVGQQQVDLSALLERTETTELDDLLKKFPADFATQTQVKLECGEDLVAKLEIMSHQTLLDPLQEILQQQELLF